MNYLAPKNMNFKMFLNLVVLGALLLVGCAKEIPEKVSEDIQNNVHDMSTFDQKIILESVGDGVSMLKEAEGSDIIALNENEFRAVKFISGPKALAPYFKDLKLESRRAGERFEVTMKLTKEYLVASVNVASHNFSSHMKAMNNEQTTQVPIFQYKVESYGILENDKNDMGEKTRTILYKTKDKFEATHVKITALAAGRSLGGLPGMDDEFNKTVFSKAKINNKLWTAASFKKVFSNSLVLNNTLEDQDLIRTKIFGDKIYVLKPVALETLTYLENIASQKSHSDPRFFACSDHERRLVGLSETEGCIFKPEYSLPVTHVGIKSQNDHGQQLAAIELDENADRKTSQLLKINTTSLVKKDKISEDIFFIDDVLNDPKHDYNYYSEYVFDKAKLNNELWSIAKLKTIFPNNYYLMLSFKDDDYARIKVYGDKLYFLKAVKSSELTPIESMALNYQPADPRIFPCSEQEALELELLSNGNCVFRPEFALDVRHVQLKMNVDEDDEKISFKLAEDAYKKASTFLQINVKSMIHEYQIGQNLLFVDRAFTDPNIDYKFYSEYIFAKGRVHNQLWKMAKFKELFTNHYALRDLADSEFLYTKLIGNQMVVFRAVKKADLSDLELAALTKVPKDPRIFNCSASMKEKMQMDLDEDCVFRPEYNLGVKFVGLKMTIIDSVEQIYTDMDTAVDSRDSKLLKISVHSELKTYRIGQHIKFVDEELTALNNDYDFEAEYLYVPSTLGAPRFLSSAYQFFQGQEKIVKIRPSKDGIDVYALDEDERFQDNNINIQPILTIPGRYVDYKCKEDRNQECVNGDQEDREISWSQKRYFIPQVERLQIHELNEIEFYNISGPGISHRNTKVVGYTIKKGMINIQIEKTYSVSLDGFIHGYTEGQFNDLEEGSFKMQYSYSLVRLNDVISPNYETVDYPVTEHDDFGFFKNQKEKLGINYDPSRTDVKFFLNRWNPKNGKIVYYLSDTFNKAKNKLLKEATYRVFNEINDSLARANTNLRLELKEPAGKNPGDLTNNMIVLLDDPSHSGLLGYGPSVTNPRTGEIVQAHVNMYSGSLISMTRRVWENMVDLSVDKKKEADRQAIIAAAIEAEAEAAQAAEAAAAAALEAEEAAATAATAEAEASAAQEANAAAIAAEAQASEAANAAEAANATAAAQAAQAAATAAANEEAALAAAQANAASIAAAQQAEDAAAAAAEAAAAAAEADAAAAAEAQAAAAASTAAAAAAEEAAAANAAAIAAAQQAADAAEAAAQQAAAIAAEAQAAAEAEAAATAQAQATAEAQAAAVAQAQAAAEASAAATAAAEAAAATAAAADANAVVIPTTAEAASYTGAAGNAAHLANLTIGERPSLEELDNVEQRFEEAVHKTNEQLHTYISPDHNHSHDELDEDLISKHDKELLQYAKHNILTTEAFSITNNFGKAYIPGTRDIPGVLNSDGTFKRWATLTDEQQKAAIDLITPYTYSATLTHELGHNLGLRHNFTGSTDKKNFYSEAEAHALGLHAAPAYSSIMDYSFSELNELTVLGKYDIAALRFAYAREVEAISGGYKKIDTTLTDLEQDSNFKMKPYDFCTDGNAGLSAKCNPFDEGTTLVEITQYAIKQYENAYKYRNFRNGRNEFSAMHIGSYASRIYRNFKSLRMIFEDFETFASMFGQELMEQGCGPADMAQYPDLCTMINDRRDSAKLAGQFFIDVLKMPDHICAVAEIPAPDAGPTPPSIKEFRPLQTIYNDVKYEIDYVPTSCFDPAVKAELAKIDPRKPDAPGLYVLGETGKFLRGFKDTNPRFKYIQDRAVLGTWVDKLLAMRTLTTRQSSNSTEAIMGSFAEITEVKQQLFNYISHVTMGSKLSNPIPFTKKDGSQFLANYSITVDEQIPVQYVGWIKKYFGLSYNGSTPLVKAVLYMANKYAKTDDSTYENVSREFVNFMGVLKRDIADGIANEDISKHNIGEYVYGSIDENSVAYEMINSVHYLNLLKTMDKELLKKILKDRSLPEDFTDEQRIAATVDVGLLKQLLSLNAAGNLFTEADLIGMLGEEIGKKTFVAQQLGIEGLAELISVVENLGQVPDDAPIEVKIVYDMKLEILKNFLDEKLEVLVKRYEQVLPILPAI
ncbi:MAG: zinc-dependent metalloprotease [Bacteriovoracaceae bacterium]|nr:zinc-dependent metalloprotease [Bacteriovoracaceae bacterium]